MQSILDYNTQELNILNHLVMEKRENLELKISVLIKMRFDVVDSFLKIYILEIIATFRCVRINA